MSDTESSDTQLSNSKISEVESPDSADANIPKPADGINLMKPESATPPLPEELTETSAEIQDAPHHPEELKALGQRVEYLGGLLEEANRISQDRERIIDRLHSENQQLRLGELQQAMLPLLRDLVHLFDDLQQTCEAYPERNGIKGEEVAKEFGSYRDSVADILYRYGVEHYAAKEGVTFNSKEHKALGVIPTTDQAKDRTVARTIRDGFRNEQRIIRVLEAEVYRFVAEVPPENENDRQQVESNRV